MEFLAALQKDEAYSRMMRERETQRMKIVEVNTLDAAAIVSELAALGFDVKSIGELYVRGFDYRRAIPVLLKWLPIVTNTDVKEDIVRALSVKWAGAEALGPLLREIKIGQEGESSGLNWAIANALAVLADESTQDEILRLVAEPALGNARKMLVYALANTPTPRSIATLISLVNDRDLSGHVVVALCRIGGEKAATAITPFLADGRPWVRNEVRRALKRARKG